MRQHPIDLLPAQLKARTLQGLITRQYAVAGFAAIVLVIVTATHGHFFWQGAEHNLSRTSELAEEVFDMDSKARLLHRELVQGHQQIQRYRSVANPIPVSRILAAIVDELPESMTIERLEFDLQRERRLARPVAQTDSTRPKRELRGELSGFGPSDEVISQFVQRLSGYDIVLDVRLDYSRTRQVRERTAREFRLSFVVDLDRTYQIADRTTQGGVY